MAAPIGPNNSNQQALRLQQQRQQQNQQQQLNTDVANSKTTVASTFGRQAQGKKTGETSETKKPVETFTPSTSSVKEGEEKPSLDTQAQVNAPEDQAEAAQAGASSASGQAAPAKEKTSAELQGDFLNSFTENVDVKSQGEIAEKVKDSLAGAVPNANGQIEIEPFLAAHTYNHARKFLSTKMPNASPKEIREAAKTDPEIASAVKLLDSAGAYIKAKKAEGTLASVPADAKMPAAGETVDSAGNPVADGASGAAPVGANPSDDGAGSPPQQPPQQPPDAGVPPGPGNPFHMTPEAQAQMMQERHATMLELMKIMNQMTADRQKAWAEINKIHAETATYVSTLNSEIHAGRAAAQHKHFQLYRKLLTDSWA